VVLDVEEYQDMLASFRFELQRLPGPTRQLGDAMFKGTYLGVDIYVES
jgi:hypothetical protein